MVVFHAVDGGTGRMEETVGGRDTTGMAAFFSTAPERRVARAPPLMCHIAVTGPKQPRRPAMPRPPPPTGAQPTRRHHAAAATAPPAARVRSLGQPATNRGSAVKNTGGMPRAGKAHAVASA